MFSTYGAEILAGRTFNASDVAAADAVVVNRTFVDTYLQDNNALGFRFHYIRGGTEAAATEQWFQIVGVVRDFPSFPLNLAREGEPTIYHPAAAGTSIPLRSRFDSPARFLPALSIAFGTSALRSTRRCSCTVSARWRTNTPKCDRPGAHWRGRSGS